jgi:hypothetical protein
MNTKKRIWREPRRPPDEGQAMVEFMLVIGFIFVLFISMMQLIFLMHAYTTLADAAKEGIRYAIVHGTGNTNCSGPGTSAITCSDTTGTNVKTAVVNFAASSMQNVTSAEVTVSYNPGNANGTNPCNVPGCMVEVRLSHVYKPFFGFSWPSVTLNAAADGRIMN